LALDNDIEQRFEIAVKLALGASRKPAGPDCLTPEQIAAYYEYALNRVERARCESHLAACARCQETLAALMRATPVVELSPESAARVAEAELVEPDGAAPHRLRPPPAAALATRRGRVWRIAGLATACAAMLAVVILADVQMRRGSVEREAVQIAASKGRARHHRHRAQSAPSTVDDNELALNEPQGEAQTSRDERAEPAMPRPPASAPMQAGESGEASTGGEASAPPPSAPQTVYANPLFQGEQAPAEPSQPRAAAEKPAPSAVTQPPQVTPPSPPATTEPAPPPPADQTAPAAATGAAAIASAQLAEHEPQTASRATAESAAPSHEGPTHALEPGRPAKAPAKDKSAAKQAQAGAKKSKKTYPQSAQQAQTIASAPQAVGSAPQSLAATASTRPRLASKSAPTSEQMQAAAGAASATAAAPASGALTPQHGSAAPAAHAAPGGSPAPSQPSAAATANPVVASAVTVAPVVAAVAPGIPKPPRSVLVAAPDHTVYWALQDFGIIYRSTDRTSWIREASGTDNDLLAGAAPSSAVCWAVGRRGTVLLTTDGVHWTQIKSPTSADLVQVKAASADVATVVASDGKQYSTFDGGSNWQEGESEAGAWQRLE